MPSYKQIFEKAAREGIEALELVVSRVNSLSRNSTSPTNWP